MPARCGPSSIASTRLAQAWRAKWDGRWEFGVGEDCFLHADGGGPVLVFAIDPERVLAFGRMPFTHTSHPTPLAPAA